MKSKQFFCSSEIRIVQSLEIEGVTCFCWPLITKVSDFISDDTLIVGTSNGNVYNVAIYNPEDDLEDIDSESQIQVDKTCVIYNHEGKSSL